tara:strand:- start:2094 stop:2567 length:474 start_codon:yes stop_codon:yes gene_type:complete
MKSKFNSSRTILVAPIVSEAAGIKFDTPLLTSADHTAQGLKTTMVSGAAIAQFKAVAVHSNGKIETADADAEADMPAIGIALNAAGGADVNVEVLHLGTFRDDDFSFTAGNRLFVGTDGALTATAPDGSGDFVQCIGVALNADVVFVNPAMTLVEVA